MWLTIGVVLHPLIPPLLKEGDRARRSPLPFPRLDPLTSGIVDGQPISPPWPYGPFGFLIRPCRPPLLLGVTSAQPLHHLGQPLWLSDRWGGAPIPSYLGWGSLQCHSGCTRPYPCGFHFIFLTTKDKNILLGDEHGFSAEGFGTRP